MIPTFRSLLCASLATLVSSCAGLNLQMVDRSVQRPSNIAVYFTVDTTRGDPVPDLRPEDFHIYEDNRPVSLFESRQTILQPEVAAAFYALLLVDMSGSVVGSPEVNQLVEAAASFSKRVGSRQKLAVYAFDGSPHITPIAGFGASNAEAAINSLAWYRPKDPSTNLNGAVVEAIKILDRQMDHATVPLRFGTLVVFTDGTDHAGRVKAEALRDAVAEAQVDIYAIAVGGEVDDAEVRAIGRSGTFTSKNPQDITRGFEEIGRRIEGFSWRYYLLSYCSPARAGQHQVEIEAVKGRMSGRLTYDFKADGFGPNCDPNQKPAFNVHRPRMQRTTKPK
jgi:von Willebrand factor type A domain